MTVSTKRLLYLVSFLLLTFYDVSARRNPLTQNPYWWFLPRYWLQDEITVYVQNTQDSGRDCSSYSTNDLSSNLVLWHVEDGSLKRLSDTNKLDPNVPTVYLIHGWHSDKNRTEIIWKAYLKKASKNLIVIDWQSYASSLYPESVCYVSKIGQYLAGYMCDLQASHGIMLKDVHIVGHSLGAQMSGIIGYQTQKMGCGIIGRITALSPAGPYYQGAPLSERVDASDAKFVDAIHTDQGTYGYVGSVGHVDFYPNCGYIQPGCVGRYFREFTLDILSDNINYMVCNHERSILLFAESITRNGFRAVNCPSCGKGICLPNFFDPGYTYMGESAKPGAKFRDYVVRTRDSSPYGYGPVILS